MVAPSALAETVTPPIFSPPAELTVPLSSTSAASAGIGIKAVAANAAAAIAGRANRLAVCWVCLIDPLHQGGYARLGRAHQGGHARLRRAHKGGYARLRRAMSRRSSARGRGARRGRRHGLQIRDN